MKIYVDADACPVKKEIERVATRNKIEVLLVSNGGLRPIAHPFIKNIFVSADADAADKWIVDKGVSLAIIVRGLPSLIVTSAALLIRLSERPWDMAAAVDMLHGAMIIPFTLWVPLAIGAPIWFTAY